MTAKRPDTLQHDRQADPVEHAGNFPLSTPSSLSWRQLGKFSAAVTLAGFLVNEAWEMAQMPAYLQTAGYPWVDTLGRCTQAALGDVGIILGIYLTCSLVARDLRWGLRAGPGMSVTAATVGLIYALLVEHFGLAAGRWSYTELMPVVPVLGAGLWPLLQMTLLPPLVFLLAKRWVAPSG